MLTASSVSKSFGGAPVLTGISLRIAPAQRIGIVGPNGIGKSTLLRILAGLEDPDAGHVERNPRTTTVGLLPQELDARSDETLRAYLARRTGVQAANDALDHWTEVLAGDPAAAVPFAEALEHYLAVGGGDFDTRVGEVCAEVGLAAARLDLAMTALSGGEFARAALAAVLLSRFDVLLLDEPTNNLDFAGLAQLERFVVGTPSACVIVSHDRAFLDATVGRILEIQEQSHRGVEFTGGWSEYVAARDLARRQEYERYTEYVAQRDELAVRARAQRSWSEEGKRRVKRSGERDKNIRHFKTQRSEQQAAKARTTDRARERLEVVEKPWEAWELRMELAPVSRSGAVVARLDGAVMARGDFTLGPVDLEIGWAERVAVVGPNGAGKSTLLGAILGTVPLVEGVRWVGPGVTVGSMDQARDGLVAGASLLDAFIARTLLDRTAARTLLAKFGLRATEVDRPAASLSPGERTRAELAILMAGGVNCLVLDEPTNHLDAAAIEQLEQALGTFTGTLVLVSHDRRFLDAVHTDRVVDVDAWPVSRG
jgi:ATPase subunit of ABC transporter with duplicated ATPase domains